MLKNIELYDIFAFNSNDFNFSGQNLKKINK